MEGIEEFCPTAKGMRRLMGKIPREDNSKISRKSVVVLANPDQFDVKKLKEFS
jgi:hypothetical protein